MTYWACMHDSRGMKGGRRWVVYARGPGGKADERKGGGWWEKGGGGIAGAREHTGAGECGEFTQYGMCGWFEPNGTPCKYIHAWSEEGGRSSCQTEAGGRGREKEGGSSQEEIGVRVLRIRGAKPGGGEAKGREGGGSTSLEVGKEPRREVERRNAQSNK